MFACLDNLPRRHRSLTPYAAAPDVDFRFFMRCERIPDRRDPRSCNFPSHTCHATLPAIGISLAEIAEIPKSWRRQACARPRDWLNACGNCGNSRHDPPARYHDRREGRAERSERSETPSDDSPRGLTSALPERGRRVERGSGKCGNPLGCRYRRCFSNAVAGAVELAESAETLSDNSPRSLASALRNLINLGNLQAGTRGAVAGIAGSAEIANAAVGTAMPTFSSPLALIARICFRSSDWSSSNCRGRRRRPFRRLRETPLRSIEV